MEAFTDRTSRKSDRSDWSHRMARGLGWFSIGLGLAEIIAPGRLAKAVGLEGKENLLRTYGAREMGAGVLALTDRPAPAMWSRFAGDLLDLGTLAVGLRDGDEDQRKYAGIAIAAVAGVTLIDLLTAATLSRDSSGTWGETRDRNGAGPSNEAAEARGSTDEFRGSRQLKTEPSVARGELQLV